MASNLTGQVRNIAEVTTCRGQREICPARLPVDVKGEILELKNTINTYGGPVEFIFFGSYPCCA
jgi:hypothetical protein